MDKIAVNIALRLLTRNNSEKSGNKIFI